MLREGAPAGWGAARLEAFANLLFSRAVESERRRRLNPGAQAVLERRRAQAAIVYAPEARRAAVRGLEQALAELEERRVCAVGSWTPRAELARELGVSSVRLGRWIASGLVPVAMMPIVSEWAQRRADALVARMARAQLVADLIECAKRPALAHGLPGAPKAQAARAPDLKNHEGPFESAENQGYQWVRRVEQFSSFKLIVKLAEWALGRRLPRGVNLGRARLWIVTAIVSIYDPPDSLAQQDERRQRRRRKRSPGAYRQFERAIDRQQLGRDLMLGAVVSSRTVRRGGLERAVRLWRENMTVETCENELVFVHGLIVRHWRRRPEREAERYRKAELARWEAQHSAEERRRGAARERQREQARKQTLDRARRRARSALARKQRRP